jgi:hypothetical protein
MLPLVVKISAIHLSHISRWPKYRVSTEVLLHSLLHSMHLGKLRLDMMYNILLYPTLFYSILLYPTLSLSTTRLVYMFGGNEMQIVVIGDSIEGSRLVVGSIPPQGGTQCSTGRSFFCLARFFVWIFFAWPDFLYGYYCDPTP